MFFKCFKRPAVTACANTAVETFAPRSGEWQIEQEWVIPGLSVRKTAWKEKLGNIGKESWYVVLRPSSNQAVPDISLHRGATEGMLLNITFAFTIVNLHNPGNSVHRELDDTTYGTFTMDGRSSLGSWSWSSIGPISPGLIINDALVLHARLRASKVYVRVLNDVTSTGPDVTLQMADGTLPARRSLLVERSDYFKAMLQTGKPESTSNVVEIQKVGAAEMKLILQSINGELNAIPQDRLHSLALASHRLQVNQLKERCVTRLEFSLTQDIFAETAVLADRMKHQGLQQACLRFAMLEENRSALLAGEQKLLKRIVADAPDLAVKLVGEVLKQAVPKQRLKG